ncbi:MAG: hypothetical protein LBB98_04360 [Treponema sp.]|nr:hypothetical protein [Treponema sp.]
MTGGDKWKSYDNDSKFTLDGTTTPVWIIRNGINDEAQNTSTDFARFGEEAGANGNGAVTYMVAADGPEDPDNPQAGDLAIRDGKFKGLDKDDPTKGDIEFITTGYEGTAEVYYAVVEVPEEGMTSAPAYSAYTGIPGDVGATVIPESGLPEPHQKQISLTGMGNYDIYVVLFKDGKVSAPVKINTKSGGLDLGHEWGRRFVAAHSSCVAWSDDGGKNWATVTMPTVPVSIAYGDGVFVAVTRNSDKAAWSDDGGETWTAATLPSSAPRISVTYGNGIFVAVAGGQVFYETANKAAWSDDGGKTWTAAILPYTTGWSDVAYGDYGDGVFVATACNPSIDLRVTTQAARSEDGKTWKAVTLPSAFWIAVTYGDGVFVAVGRDTMYNSQPLNQARAAWSDDGGKTWTVVAMTDSFVFWGDVAYGDGVFLAVGTNRAARSVNGKSWTAVTSPGDAWWYYITYGDGVFVATTGACAWSEDGGGTWTMVADSGFGDVAYGE